MKQRTFAFSILSLALILSSCDKIKDLLSVKVNANFTVDLPVTIQEPLLKSTTATFLTTETFDPLSNEDLALYQDKIKGFEVTGIKGTISSISADVTLTNCKLLVTTATNSTEWNFTNLPLTNGTVITFDNTGSQWDKINEILGEQTEVTVTLSGDTSQTPVTFTLTVEFSTKALTKIL
jgi:hypothetical protein